MEELTLSPDEYLMLRRGYMGGYTHANANWVKHGTVETVYGYDFTSSYPSVMLLEKFPMSKGKLLTNLSQKDFEYYINHYCCLFNLHLYDVVPKITYEHPISVSKCYELDRVTVENNFDDIADENNGRIVCAGHLAITCTELDYFTYRDFYSWDHMRVTNMWVYQKQYLPPDFTRAILVLYKDKTTLKGIADSVIEYMVKKGMLNSTYGMTVTDIIRKFNLMPEIIERCAPLCGGKTCAEITIEYLIETGILNNYYEMDSSDIASAVVDFWSNTDKSVIDLTRENLEKKIDRYNKDKRRFLFYPWGVWVTAYARYNLFSGIKALGNDYLYSDTDSLYYINYDAHQKYFDDYNMAIKFKYIDAAKHMHVNIEDFSPVDIDGKVHPIGLWEMVEECAPGKPILRFKTLGAKRYLFEYGDSRFKFTCAGAGKYSSLVYLQNKELIDKAEEELRVVKPQELKNESDPFDGFTKDLVIPEAYSGRLATYYGDDGCEGDQVDYLGNHYHFKELSYINLEPSKYHMSMSDQYVKYLMLLADKSVT